MVTIILITRSFTGEKPILSVYDTYTTDVIF